MSKQLRAGVIGLGILGTHHARFLVEHEDVDLVAVADLRPEIAEKAAGHLDVAPYADPEEMLRREKLDYVVIATPDFAHRAPALAAISAGAPNILIEKPLATSLEDAEAIAEAVERNGTRFFINFSNRASSLDIATRYVMRQGLLGKVVYGETRLDDHIAVPTQMWGARSAEWAAGSSSAHFLLSHVVDLLRYYFDAEVKHVYAIKQQVVLGHTPDLYDAFLTLDNGLKVRVKAEWIKHMDDLVEYYTCFSGSEGTLIYNKRPGFGGTPGWRANVSPRTRSDLLDHQAALLQLGVNVTALHHRPTPTSGPLSAGGDEEAVALEHRGPTVGGPTALCGHFVAAIREDTDEPADWKRNGPLPGHLDGLEQVRVVAAIVASAETGEGVDL